MDTNLFFCPSCRMPNRGGAPCPHCGQPCTDEAKSTVEALLNTILSRNPDRVAMAVEVLTRWLPDSRAFVPLSRLLQTTSDPYLLTLAARGLGWLGDPKAIPLLADFLVDESKPYVAVSPRFKPYKGLEAKTLWAFCNKPNTARGQVSQKLQFVHCKPFYRLIRRKKMSFVSILSEKGELIENTSQPEYFRDLNLDQVIQAITARKQEYNLKPFYYTPLRDIQTIRYRQEVMRDLAHEALMAALRAFAEQMVRVRRFLDLSDKLDYPFHKEGWFLEAVLSYGQAVRKLGEEISSIPLSAKGLIAFREFLNHYLRSQNFETLVTEAKKVKEALQRIRYCIILQNGTVRVRCYEGESDYSLEVEKTFAKFKQGAVKDYRSDLSKSSGMNHVEAQILDFVARLYPEEFKSLTRFYRQHQNFVDQTIRRFDREIQFYIVYLDFIAEIQRKGLSFCLPEVVQERNIAAYQTFDIALANTLRHEKQEVVPNDFYLRGTERVIVISGPNQGGKTTFARMFGQLHYLAALGCPVPGNDARLYLCDRVFTHFEREEDLRNLSGKLYDDLERIRRILDQATPDSILILNEVFSSTTFQDAVFLSREILQRISDLDVYCVWVTFLDELSTFNEKTVSMVSTVKPDNAAERTYKIIRKPADGLAYAISLAEKHRLTYRQLLERIRP